MHHRLSVGEELNKLDETLTVHARAIREVVEESLLDDVEDGEATSASNRHWVKCDRPLSRVLYAGRVCRGRTLRFDSTIDEGERKAILRVEGESTRCRECLTAHRRPGAYLGRLGPYPGSEGLRSSECLAPNGIAAIIVPWKTVGSAYRGDRSRVFLRGSGLVLSAGRRFNRIRPLRAAVSEGVVTSGEVPIARRRKVREDRE